MTAVIYARYSTDSQREESIEGQIRECTAYRWLIGAFLAVPALRKENALMSYGFSVS